MITDEKKKRIESLSTDEMLFEINRGHESRFQREAFAYLQCCYQSRVAEDNNKQKLEISKDIMNASKQKEWYGTPFGIILLSTIGSLIAAGIWYFFVRH